MKHRLRHKTAMTLVELMIASAIFAIAFGSLMLGEKTSRFHGENSLINFITLQYAQSLLEAIQCYGYEDPTYSSASTAFGAHALTFGIYDTDNSGVYNASNTLQTPLPEESLSIRYHPTSTEATSTALKPFTISGTMKDNDFLIGPEENDKDSGSSNTLGLYRISELQQRMNIFSSNGQGMEKYFFMNDVDDFDGYLEKRLILPQLEVTFQVSVSGVYRNTQNFDYAFTTSSGTATLPQDPFAVMKDISLANLQALCPGLLLTGNPLLETINMGYNYYQNTLFKKITIKATWEYPLGSGNQHTLVIDGGKVNPQGSVL